MSSAAKGAREDSGKDSVRTVTLAELDIRAAARVLNALVGPEHDRGRELTTLANADVEMGGRQERAILQERARQVYVSRARRSHIFTKDMFGEPAWDMLLALYVTDQSGPRHTVSGLINFSGVPSTSALRWLKFLDREQLVNRVPHRIDGRVVHIELTDKARDLLDAYFAGTATEG